MVDDMWKEPGLRAPSFNQVARECVWARNNQLTISGHTPIELAFGRKPPDLLDAEGADPAQLSLIPDEDRQHLLLRNLAMRSHLRARQADDLLRD